MSSLILLTLLVSLAALANLIYLSRRLSWLQLFVELPFRDQLGRIICVGFAGCTVFLIALSFQLKITSTPPIWAGQVYALTYASIVATTIITAGLMLESYLTVRAIPFGEPIQGLTDPPCLDVDDLFLCSPDTDALRIMDKSSLIFVQKQIATVEEAVHQVAKKFGVKVVREYISRKQIEVRVEFRLPSGQSVRAIVWKDQCYPLSTKSCNVDEIAQDIKTGLETIWNGLKVSLKLV
ncbi:MAG: hypothetical protein QXP20_05750 [Candidatus Bathyarchaeia archaeon]